MIKFILHDSKIGFIMGGIIGIVAAWELARVLHQLNIGY